MNKEFEYKNTRIQEYRIQFCYLGIGNRAVSQYIVTFQQFLEVRNISSDGPEQGKKWSKNVKVFSVVRGVIEM